MSKMEFLSVDRHDRVNYADLDAFREGMLARRLFTRTLQHPEWGDLVAWAPTSWLITLANPDPLTETTTSGADGLPDRRVDLTTLFQSMLDDGMRDPLVLGIGLDHQTRLETGNQRIRCLLEHGIEFTPVIGYVNDTSITHLANGKHKGIPMEIDGTMVAHYYRQYVSPTDILLNAPVTK